mgnify:CR=1 FL=1
MSKFIIIEGTDNVGKDTQQNLIIENFELITFFKNASFFYIQSHECN